MEFGDVTFFYNIFPMKDLYSMTRLSSDVIVETPPEHVAVPDDAKKHLNQFMRRLTLKILGGSRDYKVFW
jgi:hypothetical protein